MTKNNNSGNNQELLKICIDEFKNSLDSNNPTDSEIFELFTLSLTAKNEKVSLSVTDYYDLITDGGNDGGIDAILISVNNRNINDIKDVDLSTLNEYSYITICFIQSKDKNSFEENALTKIKNSISNFFKLTKHLNKIYNQKIIDKITLIRSLYKKAKTSGSSISVKYYYFTKKEDQKNITVAFNDTLESIIAITKDDLKITDVEFKLFSAEEMVDLNNRRVINKKTLTFTSNPLSETYKIQNSTNTIGYVGFVSLKHYFEFISEEYNGKNINEDLFEDNIRHYQSKAHANEGIEKTLELESDIDFWWLNNGVTMIARKCDQSSKDLIIEDPQIVNGLQSSFVLYNYFSKNTEKFNNEKRNIFIKVLEIKAEESDRIDKIIACTNTQTPIKSAQLLATTSLQRKIESYFKDNGYYYERRKDLYKNKQIIPLPKIFGIQDTAQVIHAIVFKKPSEARQKPSSLLREKTIADKIFNDNIPLKLYLETCLIYRKIYKYIPQTRQEEVGNLKFTTKLFTLHISRIACSILLKNPEYNIENLKALNNELLTNQIIESSIVILLNVIQQFSDNAQIKDTNVSNIAKNSKFSNEIEIYLKTYFNNEELF